MKSAEEHLTPDVPDDAEDDTTSENASDNEDAHDVGEIQVDDHPDEDEDIVWAEDGEAVPIGGKITVGQKLHGTTGAVLTPGM